MEKILFITNKIFIDHSLQEGGVRLCTEDYIKLLACNYEVIYFPITFNKSVLYRLKAKFGIDIFEDYNPSSYEKDLLDVVSKNKISKIFINLSSASRVSETVRKHFKNHKIILCSHGIESGDFLHEAVRFKKFMNWTRRLTSGYRLGSILKKELEFRLNNFDLILTVSEIEASIENWLGAKKVFFVPRIFEPAFIKWKPIFGRVGFVADVSHFPNYFGLLNFCEAVSKKENLKIEIRVTGKPSENLNKLISKFPFITSVGYLDDDQLLSECGSWMYYLNLVFYFSKGVSTKLAKGMNLGLPVLSTPFGNRGYNLSEGKVITCINAEQMVAIIDERIVNPKLLEKDRENVQSTVMAYSDYNVIMKDLLPILNNL